MTEYVIAARREGSRVAIDTMLLDADYRGILNTSYLDAESAIRFGEAVAAWGRRIKKTETRPHGSYPS